MIVGNPLINLFIAHPDSKLRCPVVLIKILDIDFILPWSAVEAECSRASCRLHTLNRSARGSVLPGLDVNRHEALKLHGFRLNTIRVISYCLLYTSDAADERS